jgi:hypothetical protein
VAALLLAVAALCFWQTRFSFSGIFGFVHLTHVLVTERRFIIRDNATARTFLSQFYPPAIITPYCCRIHVIFCILLDPESRSLTKYFPIVIACPPSHKWKIFCRILSWINQIMTIVEATWLRRYKVTLSWNLSTILLLYIKPKYFGTGFSCSPLVERLCMNSYPDGTSIRGTLIRCVALPNAIHHMP